MTIVTSLLIKDDKDGIEILKEGLRTCFDKCLDRFRDVKEHFTVKKNISADQLRTDAIANSEKCFEVTFNKAEISSGKSDDLDKNVVLSLKNDISEIMSKIP